MTEVNKVVAARVRQLIPISDLPTQIQNKLINPSYIKQVKKGGVLFKQGDRDDFSFYILDGEIELLANKKSHGAISTGTDRARYAMAQLQPRQFTARAKSLITIFKIARDGLDKLVVLHEKESAVEGGNNYDLAAAEIEVEEIDADDEIDWMTKMLQSELFERMPAANMHQLFASLKSINYQPGKDVIKQGEAGNHYYIIQEGRCEVLRKPPKGSKELKLAELGPGDGFGEEALIAETTRNASVRMITPGVVGQLSKDAFIELIKKPAIKSVTTKEAREIVAAGGKWVDVRFPNEYKQSTVGDAVNIPLNVLRMELGKLDFDTHYVLFCATGGRSSTAAFLLAEKGIEASFLTGGLVNSPELAPPEDVTNTPKA